MGGKGGLGVKPHAKLAEQVNGGRRGARGAVNAALIGLPRGDIDHEWREASDHAFIAQLGSVTFAGRQTMALRPFAEVLARAEAAMPADLIVRLSHSGVMQCRLARGTDHVISNHAWGIAIDLKLDGETMPEVDCDVVRLAKVMAAQGLVWGLAYGAANALHFEASAAMVRDWADRGVIRGCEAAFDPPLGVGDRGPDVSALQRGLNGLRDPQDVDVDGIFGTSTQSAVIDAEVRLGLPVTGRSSPALLDALSVV